MSISLITDHLVSPLWVPHEDSRGVSLAQRLRAGTEQTSGVLIHGNRLSLQAAKGNLEDSSEGSPFVTACPRQTVPFHKPVCRVIGPIPVNQAMASGHQALQLPQESRTRLQTAASSFPSLLDRSSRTFPRSRRDRNPIPGLLSYSSGPDSPLTGCE